MDGVSKTFRGLGTKNILTLIDPPIEELLEQGGQIIHDYEDILTINQPESEIIAINQAAGLHPVSVSEVAYDLVKKAVQVSRAKLGFDVAIGPLVQEWRIGFQDAHVPSDDKIKRLLNVIDPNKIHLDDEKRSVFLEESGMQLDMGGIGKGYIADAIKTMWLQNSVTQGIINLGGNVLLVGPGLHGQRWKVGVQDPTGSRNQSMGIIETTPCSVVTSGVYERFLNKAGHTYHHIFDPATGYPLETDLKSVTVFTPTSLEGEIWSSLAFFNGPQKTAEMLQHNDQIGYVFITNENKVIVSDNLITKFKLIDHNFELATV